MSFDIFHANSNIMKAAYKYKNITKQKYDVSPLELQSVIMRLNNKVIASNL